MPSDRTRKKTKAVQPRLHGSSRFTRNFGTCVQEWTGWEWIIIDEVDCAEGYEARPLDPREVAGQHVGQRVLTPCQPRRPKASKRRS
jgi:hypothetical protein